MHYFKHHIGDYRKDTGHLTLLEHGAYRQLIDLYYLDEKPLPSDDAKVMRLACARTADEKEAVKNVLSDFFDKTSEGYRHKRCDCELERIYEKSEKARKSAKVRWRNDADAERTECERNANASETHGENAKNACDSHATHNPLTHNPLTHNPLKEKSIAQNDKAFAAFWSAYPRNKHIGEAEMVWGRIKPDEELFSSIMSGLAAAKESDDWKKEGGQFIPYPAKWLNAKGWEDEISTQATAPVNYLEGVRNA